MIRERIVVICPGRGSYTRDTALYLDNYGSYAKEQINYMNAKRKLSNLPTLSELDKSRFRAKLHMSGEHASPLIYACSVSDFLSIDQNKYDIVALTGNSMGWYTALGLSGVLSFENTYNLISTMGSMMLDGNIGGQIIYPLVNDNWKVDKSKKREILEMINSEGAHISIILGGYLVIGGKQKVLDKLLQSLTVIDKYPFQLPYHSAFHTPLMDGTSKKSLKQFSVSKFNYPKIPLIDGRGFIWKPYSTNTENIWEYTLGHQVVKPYDFTRAIKVAIKEFCPDRLVLLGPGNSLGGPIGQILIENEWLNINSKTEFLEYQNKSPFLISMGLEVQRDLISL